MKRAFCALLAVCPLALAALIQPASAVAPPVLPDLKDFRTGATAITARVSSAAAPVVAAQPAYLGINLENRGGQLVVAQIAPGSPAESAGLRVGDVVRSAAGSAVADSTALG